MVLGISEKVFFSGMPSEAAGPVAETVTPTLMSACATPPAPISAALARASRVFWMRFMCVSMVGVGLSKNASESWGLKPS